MARVSLGSSERAKLAYVAASRIPGRSANGFQVMKMAEALRARHPQTTLIAIKGDATAQDDGLLRRLYGVEDLPELRLISAPGRYGIHLFNLHAAVFAFLKRFDLLLTRSIGAAAIAARLGVPTIWECHAPPQGFECRYWSALARAKAFRRLVVISHALHRLMAERHDLASLDVVVAPDGVDVARFAAVPAADAAKRAAGRDPERPIAGYAGHLYAGRGIDIIFDCAAALPHWTFLVAGGLPEDVAAARRECETRGLSNVELLGFVDNSELPARLAVADVLLMPYQRRVMISGGRLDTVSWMSPLKMFEYMAMGRAIVASDLPVLHEVLDDACAILVPPDDAGAWIAALSRLADDPSFGVSCASAAKRRAPQYAWDRRVERMLAGLNQTGQ